MRWLWAVGFAAIGVIGGGYYWLAVGDTPKDNSSVASVETTLAPKSLDPAKGSKVGIAEVEASALRVAADAEVKRNAEEETRRKAEVEAAALKAAADAEVKRKAEEETRRKAEVEASALRAAAAETEAKRKAEEETRRKAEVEVAALKAATEAEVKRKAEMTACRNKFSDIASKGGITFKTGGGALDKRALGTLDELVQTAKSCANIVITVEGHTDSAGSDEANKRLSQRRAQAVVDYFIGSGLDANHLNAVGYGETKPIASNDTAQGRAQNRRIQFIVSLSGDVTG